MRFPDGFVWGAATAAYQIEGSRHVDGRGDSIWDTFSHTPGAVLGGDTGDVACDHYRRFREDVAIMADLGLNAYRFSIAWPRVQPSGSGPANQAGLDFYSALVDELLAHGITPYATLYHWDLPQPLQDAGGWAARDTSYRLAEYASLVTGHLGDRVPDVITLNEPWCSAFLGYASGAHAPGIRDTAAAIAAAHHLLLGHGLAVEAMRAAMPSGSRLGITVNPHLVRAVSDSAEDQDAAEGADLLTNRIFLDPVLLGTYPKELTERTLEVTDWSFVHDGDLATISAPIDFLGLNYYQPLRIGAVPADAADPRPWPGVDGAYDHPNPPPHTGMGWGIDPDAFAELIGGIAADYPDIPILITENGSAFDDVAGPDGSYDDRDRAAFLTAHLEALHRVISEGVDVTGYFAWSLMDNFEWAWGYSQRFGLVHVDYETQKRTVKRSGQLYREIIAANGPS